MARLHYAVIATLPNKDLLHKYTHWLETGHLKAVIEGGAISARLIALDPEPASYRVRTLYEFEDRASFDRYVRDRAPALRADGLARFGPETGATFEREVGVVRYELGDIRCS